MSLWDTVKKIGGLALPFIGGGLTPLISGTIAGGLGLFGGGGQEQPTAGGYMPAGGGGTLADYLAQQAFMDALRERMAEGEQGETFNVQRGLKRAQSRQRQQAGGMSFPATARPSLQGLGSGEGRGAGSEGRGADGGRSSWWDARARREPQPPPTAPTGPTTGDLYREAIQRSLAGVGGLPANIYQGAQARGLGIINRQAQFGREQLRGTLGQRGMLTSGLMGGGLGQLEQGRLGAIGAYTSELELAGLSAARQAQERGMNLYLGELEGERDRQLQRDLQGKAISAGEPDFFDYLAGGLGAYGQYQALKGLGSNIAPGSYGNVLDYKPLDYVYGKG